MPAKRLICATLLLLFTGCKASADSESLQQTMRRAEADSIRRVQLQRQHVEGNIPDFSVYESIEKPGSRVKVVRQGSLQSIRAMHSLVDPERLLYDEYADPRSDNVQLEFPDLEASVVLQTKQFRKLFRCIVDCIPGTVEITSDSVTDWRGSR